MSAPTLDELQSLERQIQELKKRRLELKRSRGEEIARDYSFDTPSGPITLSSLFGPKRDLIVIHNMGRACSYCTLWADGLNGLVPHLESRASLAFCSPDQPDDQARLASERGWRFRMISDRERSFTHEMGFWSEAEGFWPGFSTFHRGDDRRTVRVASDHFGPGDDYCALWPMLDLLADGPAGWEPAERY